ncbi:MAG: nuclear transport factor 2 family protein [Pseudomonadota bacterium]
MIKLLLFLLFIVSALTIVKVILSDRHNKEHINYTERSISSYNRNQGVTITETMANDVASRFSLAFEALPSQDFKQKFDALFSDNLDYVNDTLGEHHSKSSLAAYFLPMSERVTRMNIDMISVHYSNDSLYLHWNMTFTMNVIGTSIPIKSSGISHLKCDDRGAIIYQQDYWDPNNGLYRNLPYIGWLYRWLLPLK